MSKTVTSLFRSPEAAADVVTRLEQIGIDRDDITVHTGSDSSFVSGLDDLGVPRSDAQAYAEGVRRGGSLVVVECDDDEVDRVTSVMDRDGVLDLDEQQSAWRREGWTADGSNRRNGGRPFWRAGRQVGNGFGPDHRHRALQCLWAVRTRPGDSGGRRGTPCRKA